MKNERHGKARTLRNIVSHEIELRGVWRNPKRWVNFRPTRVLRFEALRGLANAESTGGFIRPFSSKKSNMFLLLGCRMAVGVHNKTSVASPADGA